MLVLNAGLFGRPFNLTEEEDLDETFQVGTLSSKVMMMMMMSWSSTIPSLLLLQVNYLSQVYLASLLKGAMSKTLRPTMVVVSAESHR